MTLSSLVQGYNSQDLLDPIHVAVFGGDTKEKDKMYSKHFSELITITDSTGYGSL